MDKKVIIFLSCLLIAIPVVSALAAFYVPPQKQSVQGIAVTKAVVPTDVISPTPTIFALQTATKSAGVTISATPSAGITVSTRPTKSPRVEIKATVTAIPTLTQTPKAAQSTTAPTRIEPTPTIYIFVSPTAQPTIAKPTVAAKQAAPTGSASVNSVKIIENPSTVIMSDFSPTQAQSSVTQIDKDANVQSSY